MYKDRDSQIEAIERSFEATKVPIEKHHTKPGVTAVEEYPVYPDFDLWRHPCAQVIFDSDPARKGGVPTNQTEEMSQAMIRGMVDESGDQFVAYFLPTEDTIKKRKRDTEAGVDYEEEDEYEYTLAREYNWNVKNKMSKGYEETYFFVFKDEGVFYNELETRVRLNKRRKRAGAGPQANTRLVVKHRLMNDQEERAHDNRLTMLAPPGEEVEEETFEQFGDAEAQKSGDEEGIGSGAEDNNKEAEKAASGAESGNESDARSRTSFRSGSASPARSGSASPRSVRSGSISPRSGSASPSGSESGSESEREHQQQKNAAEIFGSSSDED